jgi:hypothetical protein
MGDKKTVRELVKGCCVGMAASFVASGNSATVATPPPSHSIRKALISWSSNHVEQHLTENEAVPIPLWSTMSGEACELDVFHLDWRSAGEMDLTRCNVLLMLHSTASKDSAGSDLEDMLAECASAAPEVPVVICGCIPLQKAQLGELGLSSVYHSFSSVHEQLAKRNQAVYALEYSCPSIWGQGFSVLYKSQMAVLYKKAALSTPEFTYAVENIFAQCDVPGSSIWDREAVNIFWKRLYGRGIGDTEFDELMAMTKAVSECDGSAQCAAPGVLTSKALLAWLHHMAGSGKADFVWMALRAFGYDGAFHNTR